jgi:hypothetical protein
MYASFLDSCAPCIWTFLNSLFNRPQAIEKRPAVVYHLQVTLRRKLRVDASFPLFITFR